MTTVLFKCAIGKKIGSGHVMRCLTLADALIKTAPHVRCKFWVTKDALAFPPLKNSPHEIITHHDESPVDLLIIDDYSLDIAFETSCRVWANKIMVIDDLADRTHDCDILLDQTYGRSPSDYNALVPDTSHILCGAQYALLRPEFAELREESLKRRAKLPHVKNILISLGSTNLHNITSSVLSTFHAISGNYNITVVLSTFAYALDEVRTLITDINAQTDHRATLLVDVTNMAQLMAESDFAIGAGGSTSWERACLGLPSAVVELADNQKEIIHSLATSHAIISLGSFKVFAQKTASQTIEEILHSQITLNQLSKASSALCNGLGVKRAIKTMEDYFNA